MCISEFIHTALIVACPNIFEEGHILGGEKNCQSFKNENKRFWEISHMALIVERPNIFFKTVACTDTKNINEIATCKLLKSHTDLS